MADLDPHSADGVPVKAEGPVAGANSHPPGVAEGNHVPPAAAPVPAGGAADDRSGLDRAEQVVDDLADKVSTLTSSWGRVFLRLGARAQEAAQDFWAEVQDFRQGKKP